MKTTWRILFLISLIATTMGSSPAGENPGQLRIFAEGKPLADIVVAEEASERVKEAAETLRSYLKKSTGADFLVTTESTKDTAIHVGMTPRVVESALDSSGLDHDGFVLQGFRTHDYVILGGSDYGTEYGVYDFLERFVGVSWLMPTEIGEYVPSHSFLAVSPGRIVENPAFLLRFLSPMNPSGQSPDDPYPRYSQWARHNRINKPDGRMSYHHQLKYLLPPSKFAKSNPEFYPFIDPERVPRDFQKQEEEFKKNYGGKRFVPQADDVYRWNPNFSAPGIVEAAAEEIISYFRQHPDATTYSLGMNDSDNFDQSPESLRRRSGKKNYLGREDISDDYFEWANAVVEKVLKVYPDKWFGVLAYNELADPPTRVRVHPRIVPFLTYERLYWLDPELEAHNKDIQARWEKVSGVLGWYEYIYGLMYMVPRIYPRHTQETLQWAVEHKVKYFAAELYPNWGEGPKAWIQAKLLWNPNRNVEDMMKIWCVKAVGSKAGPSLLRFYEIWEKFWTRDVLDSDFWDESYGQNKLTRQYLSFNDFRYLKNIPEAAVTESDKLMNFVVALAGSPRQRQRAQKLHAMWQFYKWSYFSYQGVVLTDSCDFTNPKDVLTALEKAPFQIAATRKREETLNSFKKDPLFRDIWMRVNNVSGRGGAISGGGGDVRWGYDLILKARNLAKTNEAVRAELERLSKNSDKKVQELAKQALK